MDKMKQNYYGSLCTELYEILHKEAPRDELDFYLSYAEKDKKILEVMCGSGRFLVPFMDRGFDICGIDLSAHMLERLKKKAPSAKAVQADILEYDSPDWFDYIFISSGSISLFTDTKLCRRILKKLKEMLAPEGRLVFAIETMADRCADDDGYKITASAETKEGLTLVLKSRNHYDEQSQTQFSPGIYELYDGARLLQREHMDFQTHLYRPGEMEQFLVEAGFKEINIYSSFQKAPVADDPEKSFLFVCRV